MPLDAEYMPNTIPAAKFTVGDVVYQRAQHAAHYGRSSPVAGHDLELWTFASPENVRPDTVPADADFHTGHMVKGVQHWTYIRRAPLTGTCSFCEGSSR